MTLGEQPPLREKENRRLAANLFPPAQAAIHDWTLFPWRRDLHGVIQTWKPHSSQAIAIDVFGTLSVIPQDERDAVLHEIADQLRVPVGGPWSVRLVCPGPENDLQNRKPPFVDAVAEGAHSRILFETKFTEQVDFGSEVEPLESSAVFDIIPNENGVDFQSRNNMTYAVPRPPKLVTCGVIAYMAHPLLPIARWIECGGWSATVKKQSNLAVPFCPLSIQAICEIMATHSLLGEELRRWVARKMGAVVG